MKWREARLECMLEAVAKFCSACLCALSDVVNCHHTLIAHGHTAATELSFLLYHQRFGRMVTAKDRYTDDKRANAPHQVVWGRP